MKTLETKNLELKYTNRNLISTLSEQKNELKTLKSKINEIHISKKRYEDSEKLKKEYSELLNNHNQLQTQYKEALNEIKNLKELIDESKSPDSLFGRFLKRKNSNKSDRNMDEPE